MKLFDAESAGDAWRQAAAALTKESNVSSRVGRGGDTREILHCGFSISSPRDRWVLGRRPPINPAFALAEVIWILNGRNDSTFLSYFNSQLSAYIGNDDLCYGAYGFRLRRHFGQDQLTQAYNTLLLNPTSRQVVLQIWDTRSDMPQSDGSPRAADIPCNIVSMLKVKDGALEWLQVMRSNDIFRGTPYNFVQFTFLQEIMAGWLGLRVGTYNHLADSLHAYTTDYSNLKRYQSVDVRPNTDYFIETKSVSDDNFRLLAAHIDALILPAATEEQALSFVQDSGLLPQYHNIMCLLVAEIARRKNWETNSSNSIMQQCTNPALAQVWEQWIKSVRLRRS